MEPERVPIMRPSSGVNPMVVSTLFPSRTAASEAPLPRWQIISLERIRIASLQNFRGAPRSSIER